MKHPFRVLFSAFILIFFITPGFSQNTITVEGQVIDSKTKQPLEYAAVGIPNQHLGTITNKYGCFSFYIPDSLINDSIQINFLGYESYIKPVKSILNRRNIIKLAAVSTNIEEVTVRPLSPEQILQKVIENYETNYPQEPFIAKGFYLEEIVENDKYIDFIEAYVDIYNPPFGDTSKCQARIKQGRTKDDLGSIQFMKKWANDKYKKAKKKADRKGDTINPDHYSGINVVFGGPQTVLTDDNIRNLKSYFDEKTMKKFEYSFERNSFYGGRELYVIHAKSKRPIEHALVDAKVYIDKESFAIVIMKLDMEIVVPIVAVPFIKLYRIKIDELNMNQDTEYKLVNGKWYPNKTISYGQTDLTKKYKGKYVEHSIAHIRKAFISTDIQDKNALPFPEEEQLSDKPMKEQLGEYQPEFWLNRNKIEYEVQK